MIYDQRREDKTDPSPSRWQRFSIRAWVALAVLIAALPSYAIAIQMSWQTPFRWTVVFLGILCLAIGLLLAILVCCSIARLADQVCRIAGVSLARKRCFGLVGNDPCGDRLLDQALSTIESRLKESQAINRIGQLVTTSDVLVDMLRGIAEEAVALLQADAAYVGSWESEKRIVRDVAAYNLPIMFPGREFGARDSLSSQVAVRQEPIILEDYSSYAHRIRDLDRFRLRAAIGVPMMIGAQCVGTLCVFSVEPTRRFSWQNGQLLMAFASQAAAAFEKARLHQVALDQLAELTKAREELAHERSELERALANMVHVQEEERARIAADVHDGVVQMMVGSLCEIQSAAAQVSQDPETLGRRLERGTSLIRDSIVELRRVIFNLRPITLDTAGLLAAVEHLRDATSEAASVCVLLRVHGVPFPLPRDVETGAYRIIQEALNNAVKHAEANQVEVNIHFDRPLLTVSVNDDGCGFVMDEGVTIDGSRAGLVGMRERARGLGGHLQVESDVGVGTRVRATIPCNAGPWTAKQGIGDQSGANPERQLTEDGAESDD